MPKTNVLEYLETSVKSRPDHCAVTDENSKICYADLLEQSKTLGYVFTDYNVANKPVMVFTEKSIETLCTFFGILYAGGFYVPVDPSIPASRLENIYNTLEQPLIVVNKDTVALVPEPLKDANVVKCEELFAHAEKLHEQTSQLEIEKKLESIRSATPEIQAAYVLFTSGSTGAPKGVEVSHRAIITFIDDFVETFKFNQDDIFANQAPFDFDVSVKDIYSALAVGATLAIVPRKLFSQPAALIEYVNAQRATIMIWAVAALCLVSGLHALDYAGLPTVRKVLFSGEVMPIKHLNTWLERLPECQFVNLYGPTEITCNCTYHEVDRNRNYETGLPIGFAFDHCNVTLRNASLEVITDRNTEGEICVTGANVSNGYYNNPEQTAHAFKYDETGAYMYCTGDLGYYADNNEMFFCGRKDNQIKHLGHRIELEEIDIAFEKCTGVTRCRSVFDSEKSRIHAFYEGKAEKDTVLAQAQTTLPIYMIPNSLNKVETMPLTKNGKVDRKQLLSDYLTEQQRIKEQRKAARAARN